MKRTLAWFAAIAVAAIYAAIAAMPEPQVEPKSSVVLVNRPDGHGSGVHIGKGYILTAAHVIHGEGSIEVEAEAGGKAAAELIWVSKDYDVALLHVDDLDLGTAKLACREPKLSENIEAVGNPLSITFVHTFGQVAGSARTVQDIRSVFVASMAVVPGMSGGPVFAADGSLLGIVSAVMSVQTGMVSASLVPIAFIVPSSAICGMMGR